jgi:aminoglycoside phosphotransferase (APT) family kinase protein
MPADAMPAAEVSIDEALVRALLVEQHPDLADRPLRPTANGWDNVIFRLGDDLVVRLPRRLAAVELVEHEQRWLPTLAPRLPLAIPTPVRVGVAGQGFPWPWSVCEWFEGNVAARAALADPTADAARLGAFLVALHQPAPADAPHNPYRGVPLRERDPILRDCLARLGDDVDRDAVLQRWEPLLATPAWSAGPCWVHGDLHPANVVVRDGALAAVLDFGDLTAGDPATDLAVAWMLFPASSREAFREAAGSADDDLWARAQGWALALSLAYLAGSADHPLVSEIGRRTLDEVLRDDS